MLSSSPSLSLALFQHLPDAVFLIDPHSSDILDCNAAALHQVGMERSELLSHSVLSLQKDVLGMPQWASLAQAIRAAPQGLVFVGQHQHKSGAEVPVEVCTSAFEHEGREYFVSIARNISQRLALEQDLHDRDMQLHYALTQASDGLWDWCLETNEVFFSPQLKRMLGYGPHEMRPSLESWSENVHPDDREFVQRVLHEHLSGQRERYEVEYRLRNRNGHFIWVHDRGRVCERDAQGAPRRVVGMVHNITDRKKTEQALQELASHDALTGLPNRREGEQCLQRHLERCRQLGTPLGLCVFDVDHFKAINDQFGHAVGDEVLRQIARVLGAQVRPTDCLSRWGGEEFMVVCADTRLDDLLVLGGRLRAALAQVDWPTAAVLGPVTCSFGMAVFPHHGSTAQALFMAADSALYRAKAKGRDRVEAAVVAALSGPA